mgnify:FL=1
MNNWLNKLERKYGRFGIPNLTNILVAGQILVFAIELFIDRTITAWVGLNRFFLLQGQIWRLVTFLFQPIWLGGVLGVLNLVFYFWIGNALTRVWGDFRMTLFMALGVLGAWVGCFLTGSAGPSAIFQSMLFAYTWLWPDQMVLLFGIIPFKMKYLGWFELALWAVSFVMGDFATKISLVLGLSGFLAFYGREVFDWCRDALTSWKRRRDWENRNR